MGFSLSNFLSNTMPSYFSRDKSGNWSYWLNENGFGNEENFLSWSLSNPVLFSAIATRSKLFSQMQITCVDANGNEVDAPELKLLANPNYFQNQNDFLYQYMWFMSAVGENYMYKIQPLSTQTPKALYNLIPSEICWNDIMKLDKFIVTQKDFNALGEKKIEYKLNNTTHEIPLKNITPFYDVANGLKKNSLMSSPSRVQSIKKVLCNIEENIKSKNINLKFSQKYLATNKTLVNGTTPLLKDDDRKAVENILGAKSIQITNGDVNVAHLVSDLKRLYLDEQFKTDANTVMLAFELNKNIIDYVLSGSTFDNQEQGIIRYIQSSIQPSADNFVNSLSSSLGLVDRGLKLKASYNHLPVMQSVMLTKMDSFKSSQEMIKIALENQTITQAEAVEMTSKIKNDLGL